MVALILCAVAAVVLADWLFVGKIVAGFADFHYRYWPPTWPRLITLTLAAITASASAVFITSGAMPIWPLFVWAIVFGLWMVAAVDDIARQRRIGYRSPPRYSDRND